MFKAHELFAELEKENHQSRSDIVNAMRFDMGDIEHVHEMATISQGEFFSTPAPSCLFQAHLGSTDLFFHARENGDFVHWFLFMKNPSLSQNTWRQVDFTITVSINTDYVNASRISNGKSISITRCINEFRNNRKSEMSVEAWPVFWLWAMASAVEVFSLSNVFTVEHEPPKFINAKRKKKGKLPLFSYHTLHIGKPRSGKSGDPIGTHNSPRLHFRRGHIRKLADGRRIWVNACLVGDKTKGIVQKDYIVDTH